MRISTAVSITTFSSLPLVGSAWPLAGSTACQTSWPGFNGLKHLFVFGDSYTTTGFNDTLTQPNSSNPLGNPAYPGYTASNGPNWVDFLTTTYNQSLLLTYNLAYGGATVDSALVKPYLSTVLSLKQQIQDQFIPTYGDKTKAAEWTGGDSLFAFWIGINDVGNSYTQSNETSLQDAIFDEYAGLLEQVYETGAKNFLFLYVPPVQRSPLTQNATRTSLESATQERAAIEQWNGRVETLAAALKKKYADVTTFTYDTYTLFDQVLDDPKNFVQTAGYRNTKTFCPAYEK
jgi:phospholipase/lecithinase/hemolysin